MTPTPPSTPIPADAVTWADATSAIADSIMAVGTLLTLFFIAWTVRQQGKALNLQIQQLQDVQASNAQSQSELEQHRRKLQITQARGVRLELVDFKAALRMNPLTMRGAPNLDLAKLLHDALREPPLQEAAVIRVSCETSDHVFSNLSTFGEGLRRPDYYWRQGAKSLTGQAEVDELARPSSVWFIWGDMEVRGLEEHKAEVHYSDEDGNRWSMDLQNRLRRIDDPMH